MPEPKLLRAMFGAAREHGLTKQDLNDAALVGFQKTSLRELTDAEARTILDGIRGKRRAAGGGSSGYRHTERGYAMGVAGRKRNDGSLGEYLVAARELEMLREAAALRGWSRETLDQFIRRQLRGRAIRTMREFNKVYWAVKAMNRRDRLTGKHEAPSAGPAVTD
jgi:hypothetical protein